MSFFSPQRAQRTQESRSDGQTPGRARGRTGCRASRAVRGDRRRGGVELGGGGLWAAAPAGEAWWREVVSFLLERRREPHGERAPDSPGSAASHRNPQGVPAEPRRGWQPRSQAAACPPRARKPPPGGRPAGRQRTMSPRVHRSSDYVPLNARVWRFEQLWTAGPDHGTPTIGEKGRSDAALVVPVVHSGRLGRSFCAFRGA